MSVSTVVYKSELQNLKEQAESQTKLQGRAALNFVIRLLELFGQRFIHPIRQKLGENHQTTFDQVHRSFLEIQKRLEHGQQGYAQLLCPETRKLIEKFRIGTQSDLEFFSLLKERSFGILPFSQRIILYHESPELDSLDKIERIRQKAFHTLTSRMKIEREKEEEKGVSQNDAFIQPLTDLTEEEEIGVTKLYFGTGALVHLRKTVFFSDMLRMWSSFSPQNKKKVDDFLKLLSVRGWAEELQENNIHDFLRFSETSFQKFLVFCSIDAIQKNLQMKFSDPIRSVLESNFTHSERIRSDFSYFSVDIPKFYELELSKFHRDSTPLLRSFQLFFFLKWNFKLKKEDEQALLIILIHMKQRWNENSMPIFKSRRLHQSSLEAGIIEAFHKSWDGLLKILQSMTQRMLSFSNLSFEDEQILSSPDCWELLQFLFQNTNRDLLISILLEIAKIPKFKMNLSTILEFCKKNGDGRIDEGVNWSVFLPEQYSKIIEIMSTNRIPVQDPQYLFFDPPLDLNNKTAGALNSAREVAAQFVQSMFPYKFTKEKEYCLMLRQYLLNPNGLIFELLKDVSAIGGECSEDLLYEALSSKISLLEPEDIPSNEARIQAVGITSRIQERYRFSSSQVFFLYIEILRLVKQKSGDQIGRIYLVIDQLVSFCPVFKKDDIYFLLRYHPNSAPCQVESIAKLRANWAANEQQLSRFVIDQEYYHGIISEIEKFVNGLTTNCTDDFAADKFRASCQHSLLSAFFPPLQPIGDYFRITDVTQADGARWGEPVWNTHMGQIKSLLGLSQIGIYINWSILKGLPVLFMSFVDVQKKLAYSSFIPVEISVEELKIESKTKVFYGLLAALSSQVLRETAEESPSKEDPETPETWQKCLIGVKQTIDGYAKEIEAAKFREDPIQKIWAFFQKVKLSYRHLFLAMVSGRKMPDFPSYEPVAVAAFGNIFPSHPRGCLLPKSLLELVRNCECYLPDAPLEVLESYRALFANSTEAPQELKLNLNLPDGQIHSVTYMVETSEKLTGQKEDPETRPRSSTRNEVAPPIEQVQGRYVTLRTGAVRIPLRYPPEAIRDREVFQSYFDFHNLILKAACLQQ